MAEVKKVESRVKLEGEIQDACSICFDAFWEFNPSTVTNCKHEFHLKCILDWYETSSYCPICWQHISLKDPASQELLKKVEERRSVEGGDTPGSDGINAEAASSKPKFVDEEDIVYRDGLRMEALNMLPAYIATNVNTMNEYVGIREAERLLKKSDGEVLKSSVSHLMKAAVLMVEHNRHTFDLNETSRKTQDELEGARTEIVVLRMEKAKTQEVLYRARRDIDNLRREKSNALKRANRACQVKLKLKEELKQLKGLGIEVEKLRVVVAAKEAEAVVAVESFKNSEEFEVLKQEYKRQGRVISLMQSRNELDRARVEIADLCREKASAVERASQVEQEMVKLNAELKKTVPTMNNNQTLLCPKFDFL